MKVELQQTIPQFQDRYILGEGYPWALGIKEHEAVRLHQGAKDAAKVLIRWPEELWNPNLPKYRLVLERVE